MLGQGLRRQRVCERQQCYFKALVVLSSTGGHRKQVVELCNYWREGACNLHKIQLQGLCDQRVCVLGRFTRGSLGRRKRLPIEQSGLKPFCRSATATLVGCPTRVAH